MTGSAMPRDAPPSYRCPWCGMVSYHPMDLQERFCARCDQFEDEPRTSA